MIRVVWYSTRHCHCAFRLFGIRANTIFFFFFIVIISFIFDGVAQICSRFSGVVKCGVAQTMGERWLSVFGVVHRGVSMFLLTPTRAHSRQGRPSTSERTRPHGNGRFHSNSLSPRGRATILIANLVKVWMCSCHQYQPQSELDIRTIWRTCFTK